MNTLLTVTQHNTSFEKMTTFDDLNKFTLRPFSSRKYVINLDYCSLKNTFVFNIPKITNKHLTNVNHLSNNSYLSIPYHSQR